MKKQRRAVRKPTFRSKYKNLRLHHKIIFTLIGAAGVVMVWRGFWGVFDTTPFLNHPVASLVVGLILVVISGFLFKVV